MGWGSLVKGTDSVFVNLQTVAGDTFAFFACLTSFWVPCVYIAESSYLGHFQPRKRQQWVDLLSDLYPKSIDHDVKFSWLNPYSVVNPFAYV